jgi:fructuronate reductase
VSPPRLTRSGGYGHPSAPVRLLHLGLGNFFRAHQAWYTDRAQDEPEWGYAAFSGRATTELVDRMREQDGLFTVVSRAESDELLVVSSVSKAHYGADHRAWLDYFSSSQLAAVTLTVTEAGYLRSAGGGLDREHPAVRVDVEKLRHDLTAPVTTAPARLVAGFAARRAVDAGPLAVVPCDNQPGNGAIAARVTHDLATLVAPDLADYLADNVWPVSTMVDRITPHTTNKDVADLTAMTGVEDRCPVITEPFHEWVLSGPFPLGRPQWERSGATFTDDISPYENRKLWLLNGGHSLLAYAGSLRGHPTVAAAIADDTCRVWLDEWWAEATGHLDLPLAAVAAYRRALIDRFHNPRIEHRLDQIAMDGSQKLVVRILPVLRMERAAGRLPQGATRVLAAWICCLRIDGASINDVRADELRGLAGGERSEAARRLLDLLDPAVAADQDVVDLVVEQCRALLPERSS